MLNTKETFGERLDDTFNLLKANFKVILFPIFIFSLIFNIVIKKTFIIYFLPEFSLKKLDDIYEVLYSVDLQIFLFGIIILYICYSIFYIGLYLGTIKAIKDKVYDNTSDYRDNISYGIKKIVPSFKIYWYIFSYIFLLPSLIFIYGGTSLIYTQNMGSGEMKGFSLFLIFISLFLLIIFMIFRGIRAYFSFSIAVDNDDYSKKSFLSSLKITKGKWGRIFGNILLLQIIVGISLSMVNSLVSSIFSVIGKAFGYGATLEVFDKEHIYEYISQLMLFNPFTILSDIFILFFNTIGIVFSFIFVFLLYKRLEFEYNLKLDNKKMND